VYLGNAPSAIFFEAIKGRLPNASHLCGDEGRGDQLHRSAALALIARGIRVNAIAPGVIETEMWDKIDALYAAQYGAEPASKKREVGQAVPTAAWEHLQR
jgi:hypothetical protein